MKPTKSLLKFTTLSVLVAAALSTRAQTNAFKILKCQTFDSASSSRAGGWYEQGSRVNGQDYGFSDTSNAGGTAGEAGGENKRSPLRSAYGDVFSPDHGLLSLDDSLSVTGRIATLGGSGNPGIFIGYYNSQRIGATSAGDALGLLLSSPTASSVRLDIRFEFADGSGLDALLGWATINAGQPYRFDYHWDPAAGSYGAGQMIMHLYDDAGSLLATGTYDLDAASRAKGATFDAFGINTRSLSDQSRYGTNFVDDLCYDALPGTPCQPKLSPAAISMLLSQPDSDLNVLTVSIPGSLNASTPVSLDIVSTNPSVAVASGAVQGALALTFPAGGYSSTNVPITPLDRGITEFYLTNITGGGCLPSSGGTSLVTIIATNSFRTIKSQTFDSELSARSGGWYAQSSRSGGQDYGFSNTANAGGSPGEAGGTYKRDRLRSAYADVWNSGSYGRLTLNDPLSATGHVVWLGTASGNPGVLIGYTDSSRVGLSGENNELGVLLSLSGRFDLHIGCADGTVQEVTSGGINLVPGQVYRFDFQWDPDGGSAGGGLLTANLYDDVNFTTNTELLDLPVANRKLGAAFDSFGVFTRSLSSRENYQTNYVDNLSYVGLPGAACQATLGPAASSMVSGEKDNTLAVAIPGGLNVSSPISLDIVSTNPAVAVASGAVGGKLTITFPAGGYYTTNVPIDGLSIGTTLLYLTNITGGGCISPTTYASAVTVECSPITVSPASTFLIAGQTNQSVTVSFPPALNESDPVTVDLLSLNPAVAVPQGADGSGRLTLTFPAGTTNVQSVPIEALAAGMTAFTLANNNSAGCSSITNNNVVAVSVAAPGLTAEKGETFDTSNSAASDGWVEVRSRTDYEDFGFSDTGNAFGVPGEAGGTVTRNTNRYYYADATVGNLTLNDFISASGYLYIGQPFTNAVLQIGYFNSADPGHPTGGRNILGMSISEGIAPTISAALGTANVSGDNPTEVSGVAHLDVLYPDTWNFTYDPTGGPAGLGQQLLSYTTFQGTFTITNNLTVSQRQAGATFDSFGLLMRGLSQNTNDSMLIWMDNVTYTVGGPLRILGLETLAGGQFRITFSSVASSYRVEESSSLASPSWSTVSGVTFGGPTGNNVWSAQFPVPPGSQGFFRIVANPSP